ncbi:hypothetical protein RvY_16435-2 [Ramazzottius varieornatus]|uniref:Inositol-pentakisphosphate 2-kinase n=1 Tax=Ramazzottius varieornatus TaxID=947166 RepID=A0A1D1W178_RAMVA|nr:hypothetical protein RvY_16435-2 [Ramazzottius varieornatus]
MKAGRILKDEEENVHRGSHQEAAGGMDTIEEGMPWEYRGEGNSSLVLVSPKSRLVLRLRKIRPPKPLGGRPSFSEAASSMRSLVSYVDHVIRPMLPRSEWIPKMQVIPLPDNTALFFPDTAARDARRMTEQYSFHKEAILMRDLCFLTSSMSSEAVTFSVEIKPKEGVLPAGDGVHPARKNMSKYRLKQIMKVQEGIIRTSNEYDPMDLFSGNHDRMKVSQETFQKYHNVG